MFLLQRYTFSMIKTRKLHTFSMITNVKSYIFSRIREYKDRFILDFLSMLMVVAFGMIMMQGLGNLIQELLNMN